VGNLLMAHLISVSETEGIWTLQAGIFPENQESISLHIRHGFREIGRRARIGKMSHGPLAGCWRDVLLLERRSEVAGV
jgi:phosphinothricin acetyltransferase